MSDKCRTDPECYWRAHYNEILDGYVEQVERANKAEAALASKTEEAERLREALGASADALFRAKNMLSAINESEPSVDRRKAFDRANAAWLEALRSLRSSPESAPAPDGVSSAPCRCTGIGTNPSHKPPCAPPYADADEPLDGWPCVECGRAGEACVCGPCGVLGCRNDSPCPVHDTDAHARDLRRLDERDRVVGASRAPAPALDGGPCPACESPEKHGWFGHAPWCRAPAPESAETANSSSKETDHGR